MGKIWDLEQFGNKEALKDDKGNSVTYSEIVSLSRQVNDLNPGIGGSGDKGLVILLCRNMIGALLSYAAFINTGYSVMLVSTEIPIAMRNDIIKSYLPGYLIMPEKLRGDYPHMAELMKLCDYSVLKTNYDETYPVNPDLGLMITTSGSTGSLKFVRQSFENVRFNAEANAKFMELNSKERTITALPMQYSFGETIINATLTSGGLIAATERSIMEEEFWDFFEEEEITSFHGVPNTYDMLMRIGIFEDDFPALKLLSTAGGRMSNDLFEYYAGYAEKYGKRFYSVYGQSEASGVLAYLPDPLKKTGSVGKPVPGGKITLIDEEGRPINEPGRSGEIVYEGPNVAMGYAQGGEDLIKGAEWGKELRTGDVGCMDEDGYLYITGRIKRFIKMYGHRVSLDELDEKIMDNLHILSASTGKDNDLVIFVTKESEKEAVSDFIRKNVATARQNFHVKLIGEFPRTETGKIKYSALPVEEEV